MTEPRKRSNVFGEAADEYDAVRPDYPAALVGDLLAEAGPGPVLEVGAGTGKATVAFAEHRAGKQHGAGARDGAGLVALEPDARMAALLQQRALPGVEVVVAGFETWVPPRQFGLLYSAQAWHWIDQAKRNDLAWAALAPGGLLGLFWNQFQIVDARIHEALAELDERYWPGQPTTMTHWQTPATPGPGRAFAEEWGELELHEDPRFTELRGRTYDRVLRYSAADYARFLATTSLYRLLEPEQLAAVCAETVATVDKLGGGTIEIHSATQLATARRV